jgi:predicted dehydrogenase
VKFLIAGLGSIGRRHLRNLLALGERDILLYRTHQSSLPDDELAGFPVELRLEAALAHQPDVIIVANPTALHLQVAIPAVRSGCHLLLEKPVSHTLEGVNELQAAVKNSGSRALVGYQFRFHPGLQKAAGLLKAGAIGRPISAHAHWGEYLPSWHPWEDYRQGYSAQSSLGGGAILTLSHPLDYLRWLLGEVESVWAYAGKRSDLELDVEDCAEIGLKFRQGTLASVHLDYNQRPPEHSLEIIGTQGTLRWNNRDGAVSIFEARPESQDRNNTEKWQTYPIQETFGEGKIFERNDLFLAEMRHLILVARDAAESICTLDDGIQAQRIALAAQLSARQGILVDPESLE